MPSKLPHWLAIAPNWEARPILFLITRVLIRFGPCTKKKSWPNWIPLLPALLLGVSGLEAPANHRGAGSLYGSGPWEMWFKTFASYVQNRQTGASNLGMSRDGLHLAEMTWKILSQKLLLSETSATMATCPTNLLNSLYPIFIRNPPASLMNAPLIRN